MPRKFYSAADIEDLVQRGIRSLEVNDQVVLTDLAYEKALQAGLQLVGQHAATPPAAPIRPYVEEPITPSSRGSSTGVSQLHQRIRQAVLAKLGSQVDPAVLDVIIRRVLQNTGLK